MSSDPRRLMEFHDGELDEDSKEALEAEVRLNPSARAKLRGLALLGDLVREAESSRAAPPDLVNAILDRTVGRPAPGPRAVPRRPWQRFAPAAAGVLALAAGVAVVMSTSRQTEPTGAVAPMGSPQKPAGSVAVAVLPTEPAEAGVSIQSVDFGTTRGAIFLVPGGQSETMVVWTLEDANDKG